MSHELHLYEELMLLALRDEKGTVEGSGMYHYSIGGAIAAELLLEKRIRVTEDKKKLVEIVKSTRVGDKLLDECLQRVRDAKRRGSLKTWVQRFAGVKKLKHRIAGQLVRRGILRADEDKVLLVFKRKIYPEVDPIPEREIIERLRRAIFTDTNNVAPRTVVLLSLAKAAGLLTNVFDKKDLKSRKARIEKVVNGEATGKATSEVIDAVQAAIMVAVIIPAVVSTTVTTS